MDTILSGMQGYAVAYLDNIVVYSPTWNQYLSHLEDILNRLLLTGLTIKKSKCHFAKAKCTFLGHVVGQGQIKLEGSKSQAIRDFQPKKMCVLS